MVIGFGLCLVRYASGFLLLSGLTVRYTIVTVTDLAPAFLDARVEFLFASFELP